jgi:ABC-type transport system involved in multi-copper enzyme maturation permease subunit/cbb3-type cytochrome oxidase subunit 3
LVKKGMNGISFKGKRCKNKIINTFINTVRKKSFIAMIIFIIIIMSITAFAYSPKNKKSIGAQERGFITYDYENGTYNFGIYYYHATSGIPFNNEKCFLEVGPTDKANCNFTSGSIIHRLNFTIKNGYAFTSFRSNKAYRVFSPIAKYGSEPEIIVPVNSTPVNTTYYFPVYDCALAYKGSLEIINVNVFPEYTKTMDYRLLLSNGKIINLGESGGFTHETLSISYNFTHGNAWGLLEHRVNGSWVTSHLSIPRDYGISNGTDKINNKTYQLFYILPSEGTVNSEFIGEISTVLSLFLILFEALTIIFIVGFPVSDGQTDFILSLPVKRWNIYAGKYLALATANFLAVLATFLTSYLSSIYLLGTFLTKFGSLYVFSDLFMVGMSASSLTFFLISGTKNKAKQLIYPLTLILFLFYGFSRISLFFTRLVPFSTIRSDLLLTPNITYISIISPINAFQKLSINANTVGFTFIEVFTASLIWTIIFYLLGEIQFGRLES